MVYVPQHVVDIYNCLIVCVYVLLGLLLAVAFFAIFAMVCPDKVSKINKWFRKLFGMDKVVSTVYSDKSKNYSGTEFLPVPMKAPTKSFSYEFLGWNKFAKNQKGEFIIEPIFLKKVKICVVKVFDDKNNEIESYEVEYGAGIQIEHKFLKKEPLNEFEYEFIGWDKDTKAIYENTEIRPIFKAKPIKYTYKFILDDGSVIAENTAICGTPIIAPTDPVKVDSDDIYDFVGWIGYKRNMVLDKDYIFVAEFAKSAAKSSDEKIKKQKEIIEVTLNEYKPKKATKDYSLQDKQNFKSSVSVNKNKTKTQKTKVTETKSEQKSLLSGVIVEKNTAKKSKSK